MVSASTPQGCIWNSVGTAGRGPTSSRFNPTRVHLEPTRRPGRTPPVKRFNPTRVHLEHDRARVVRARVRASTPQGCIWNARADGGQSTDDMLQPHKGASGTTKILLDRVLVKWLQPHKGASGTRIPPLHVNCAIRASTPQGCIWNTTTWSRRSANCASFNPTRVHLEPCRISRLDRLSWANTYKCFRRPSIHPKPPGVDGD